MPAPRDSSASEFVFRLPHRSLRIAAIAFGVGLLLFLIVWWRGRDNEFYRPQAQTPGPQTEIEALPEPLPAHGGASGLEEPHVDGNEQPQIVEEAAMPESIEEAPPVAPVEVTEASAVPAVALAPGDTPVPIPGQTPPPTYPRSALRRGDSGTVLVRVEVGVDGVPTNVDVVSRSGSRDLDNAAVEAVRQWRFNPAQKDGQAITGDVMIPVDFNLHQ